MATYQADEGIELDSSVPLSSYSSSTAGGGSVKRIVNQDPNRREWEFRATTASALGLENMKGDKKYCLTIDDSNNDPPSVEYCYLLTKKSKEEPYNYNNDLELLKYTEERKIFQFIANVIKSQPIDYEGPEDNINMNIFINVATKILKESVLTDDNIHQSLNQQFGLLNKNCTEYQKLFCQYKEPLEREYCRWIKRAGEIIQLHDLYLEVDDVQVEQLETLMGPKKPSFYMTKSESTTNKSVNMFQSKVEPYSLPRSNFHEFIKENMAREKRGEVVDDGYLDLKKGKLNLGFFDPLTDIETVKYVKLRGSLRHPLVMSILNILKKYPLGVTAKVLKNAFMDEHGYEIDYKELGFKSFEQLIEHNDRVFKRLTSTSWPTLIFPASLEVDEDISAIHKKIFHLLLGLLRRIRMPLPIKNASEYLNNMFQVGINVKAWGIDEELYYKTLVGEWGPTDVEIVEVPSDKKSTKTILMIQLTQSYPNKKSPPSTHTESTEGFDFSPSSFFPSPLENEKFSSGKKQESSTVNSEFILTKRLDSVADFLRPEMKYIASADLMIHPCNFFVSLHDHHEEKNFFIKLMNETYDQWQQDRSMSKLLQVDVEHAKVGVYVVVRYENEWLRGKIVNINGDKYKLLMVDLGIYGQNIKLQEIKYLHADFVDFPQQSFSCRFRLRSLQHGFGNDAVNNGDWKTVETQTFYSLLEGNIFGLVPLRRVSMRRGLVWEVKLFSLDNQDSRETIVPDLALSFVEALWPDILPSAMSSIRMSPTLLSSEDEIVH